MNILALPGDVEERPLWIWNLHVVLVLAHAVVLAWQFTLLSLDSLISPKSVNLSFIAKLIKFMEMALVSNTCVLYQPDKTYPSGCCIDMILSQS